MGLKCKQCGKVVDEKDTDAVVICGDCAAADVIVMLSGILNRYLGRAVSDIMAKQFGSAARTKISLAECKECGKLVPENELAEHSSRMCRDCRRRIFGVMVRYRPADGGVITTEEVRTVVMQMLLKALINELTKMLDER